MQGGKLAYTISGISIKIGISFYMMTKDNLKTQDVKVSQNMVHQRQSFAGHLVSVSMSYKAWNINVKVRDDHGASKSKFHRTWSINVKVLQHWASVSKYYKTRNIKMKVLRDTGISVKVLQTQNINVKVLRDTWHPCKRITEHGSLMSKCHSYLVSVSKQYRDT